MTEITRILSAVEHDDFDVRIHSCKQVLIIRHSGVDEGDFYTSLRRHVGRQGMNDILTAALLPTGILMRGIRRHRRFCLFLCYLF